MKRILFVVLLASACNKPTEDDCRKALINMQHLMGTETSDTDAKLQGEVRRCRGGSTKESVACAMNANTLDDLKKCGFYRVSAGSAAGSAAAGSAK